jgi:hypothetical protein
VDAAVGATVAAGADVAGALVGTAVAPGAQAARATSPASTKLNTGNRFIARFSSLENG